MSLAGAYEICQCWWQTVCRHLKDHSNLVSFQSKQGKDTTGTDLIDFKTKPQKIATPKAAASSEPTGQSPPIAQSTSLMD